MWPEDRCYFDSRKGVNMKASVRSARVAPVSRGAILYCEANASVLAEQSKMFEKAGYTVERAHGRAAAMQALGRNKHDIVVLGHTLTKDDRHHLPYMAKKADGDIQVLVLHASGKHPAVDISLDSRDGEKKVLAALNSLAELKYAVAS
jgi:CheY-like chemotaxis protein